MLLTQFFYAVFLVLSIAFASECSSEIDSPTWTTFSESSIIDFVADTGDGFKSTFSVARAMANPVVVFPNNLSIPRANVLIVGGDIAYPESTIELLIEKFVFPFRLALDFAPTNHTSSSMVVVSVEKSKTAEMVDWMDPTRISTLFLHLMQTVIGNHPGSDFRRFSMKKTRAMHAIRTRSFKYSNPIPFNHNSSRPNMLAIMGNHDAIDGGEGFQRLFLENAAIGGWTVKQNRSYWAFRASRKWVFLGLHDQQAAGANPDMDPEQWFYFSQLLACSKQQLNVVLVVHAPFWLQAKKLGIRLTELLQDIETYNHSLRLILSGDQHVYAHYTSVNPNCPHLIISGGGGAFTHSTTYLPPKLNHENLPHCTFFSKQVFPSKANSVVMHFDAIFWVWIRRITQVCGMLMSVLLEYRYRHTLLEAKEKKWWLLQIWLSRRTINRRGQVHLIVPPRYQLWMTVMFWIAALPLLQAFFFSKPLFATLANAPTVRTRLSCLLFSIEDLLWHGPQALLRDIYVCIEGGGRVWQYSFLENLHEFVWEMWKRNSHVLLIGIGFLLLGPPKKIARKWEGSIGSYLSMENSKPKKRSLRSLPKYVPLELTWTSEGRDLCFLIAHDARHWDFFQRLQRSEHRMVYEWLVKITIGLWAFAYLLYFLLGFPGLVCGVSLLVSALACLHSISSPYWSFTLVSAGVCSWLMWKVCLLEQPTLSQLVFNHTVLFSTWVVLTAACVGYCMEIGADFVDIFEWTKWKPIHWWYGPRTTFSNSAQPVSSWGLRLLDCMSRFSFPTSVWPILVLWQRGLTMSLVFIFSLSCCSAFLGPEVFPDDALFSAARNEHFKHFLRMQISSDSTLTVYPVAVETHVATNAEGTVYDIPLIFMDGFQVAQQVFGQFATQLKPIVLLAK